MSTTAQPQPTLLVRPKRADARRNYEKVLAAAREAFLEGGEATSLEEIARRAGVGIGTLYRHFPNRQALLEALYAGEVEELCPLGGRARRGGPVGRAEPLVRALHRATWRPSGRWPRSCMNYMDKDAPLFKACRASMFAAGEPLLKRAQEAGAVRPDVEFGEILQMVMGIGKIPTADPAQTEHMLQIALDGLRYRPS